MREKREAKKKRREWDARRDEDSLLRKRTPSLTIRSICRKLWSICTRYRASVELTDRSVSCFNWLMLEC